MENLRNRIDVKNASNKKNYGLFKRLFKTKLHVTKNILKLVTTGKNKVTLTLNKPAYVRVCILELSKVLMYEFHYNYIKNKYGNNRRLLFTATGSLIYEIKTEDVHEDFSNDKEMLDFSNYLTKSKYYNDLKKN